ncbi:MAG: hypothetical protein JJ900_11520 [Rhodospirillales bacterium]|nr:hypothetical protein [Rhodospirillales bacterium]MBO6787471.1 hypothetical protein [Rhodospirillales bacterium]
MSGLSGPYLIVHNIGHVRDAVTTAKELGRPVTLISAPGAAASLGPDVYRRMVEAALSESSATGISAVIDCADDPGQAMQAIRLGCRNIRLDADEDVLRKLRDMTTGEVLDGTPLAAYDMSQGSGNLAAWLQGQAET